MNNSKPVVVICSSLAFYRQAVEIESRLSKLGFEVTLPMTAKKMKESCNFEVDHYKTWFADAGDYHIKANAMRTHFEEIEKGDAVLVLNYEKHGKQNYIGGNVLMEMSLAFWLKKPVFILNDIPVGSSFEEEIKGMEPLLLHGDINSMPEIYRDYEKGY